MDVWRNKIGEWCIRQTGHGDPLSRICLPLDILPDRLASSLSFFSAREEGGRGQSRGSRVVCLLAPLGPFQSNPISSSALGSDLICSGSVLSSLGRVVGY
jgi:hypothetical protein